MFTWLKPAPVAKKQIAIEKQHNVLYKYRLRILISTILAYALYYIVKSDFTLSSPYLTKIDHLTKAEIGLVLSALAVSYGIGKFFMGIIADRLNPRYFVALGLIISSIFNLLFGYTNNYHIMFLLMIGVGVSQGIGAPCCQKSLATWFDEKNLGTATSIWNTSHNIGSGTASVIVGTIVTILGVSNVKNIFWIPSLISIGMAFIVAWIGVDTPESVGLPPIKKEKNENIHHNKTLIALKENVLKNPLVWSMCILNAFSYILRYGIEDWLPIYLSSAKGFNTTSVSMAFSIFEYSAVPGTIILGLLSDKVLSGKRLPIIITTSLIVLLVVPCYMLAHTKLVIMIILSILGICIYAQQVLIGIVIMDVLPIESVASGIGLSGFFGYAFGEVVASYGIGSIVGKTNWNGGFIVVFISAFVCLSFFIYLNRKFNHSI